MWCGKKENDLGTGSRHSRYVVGCEEIHRFKQKLRNVGIKVLDEGSLLVEMGSDVQFTYET